MALISSLAALLGTAAFGLLAAALGQRIVKLCHVALPSEAEQLLCATALGVIAIEVGLFFAQLTPNIKIGVELIFVLALLIAAPFIAMVGRRIIELLARLWHAPSAERLLASLAGVILTVEGIATMAPVTGSDALQYHFAAPLVVLRTGFHPNFFMVNSFLCGQGHLLILAGLAAGSDRLSMGFLFLGGMCAAAATFCVARLWTSRAWAWIVAICFLVTPVIVWQISSAGAPDIWMCFFATLAVLLIVRLAGEHSPGTVFVIGMLAGGLAGAKYTGCFVALGVAIAFLWEERSWRGAAIFASAALCAGIWPYARNWAWTGDPMFPMLIKWIAPSRANYFTIASQLSAAGATEKTSLLDLFRFSLFAEVDRTGAGPWELLGPLPLIFAPFLLLAIRNTRAWRTTLIVWAISAVFIGETSHMDRFLLPVFPVALAASFAGIANLKSLDWNTAQRMTQAMVLLFVLAGMGGVLLYSGPALRAATGVTSPESYLQQRAPDDGKVEALNQALGDMVAAGDQRKTLVFWRHVYYLTVPYLKGDPDVSWAIDPLRFQTEQSWRELFRQQNIGWIARASDYPESIATPLRALEADGTLVPIAAAQIDDFAGMRAAGERKSSQLVILQVKP